MRVCVQGWGIPSNLDTDLFDNEFFFLDFCVDLWQRLLAYIAVLHPLLTVAPTHDIFIPPPPICILDHVLSFAVYQDPYTCCHGDQFTWSCEFTGNPPRKKSAVTVEI